MAEPVYRTYPQFDAAGPIVGDEPLLIWQNGRLVRIDPNAIANYIVNIGGELLATSATPVDLDALDPGEGQEVTLTIQPDKGFVPGDQILASSNVEGIFIRGLVTAYSDTALTFTADIVSGAGVNAHWTVRAEVSTQQAAALALKAPLVSPSFSGIPTAPTPALGTNTGQIATTAFVAAAVQALINSAPGALDTLAEIAAALGDDANFAASMTTALGAKAPLASPGFSGTPTVPTASIGTNNTQAASTAFARAAAAAFAFPSGTKMLFIQTAAPTGWTKDTTHNNKALRVVSGSAGSGGSVPFSTVFGRTATDGHSLSVAQMPSHAHSTTFTQPENATLGGSNARMRSFTGGDSVTISTNSQGSNQAHSHSIDLRVRYVDTIIATKD